MLTAMFGLLLGAASLNAQNYSIQHSVIGGGGGVSAGGNYTISGTVGQSGIGSPSIGGNYALQGGFWSLIGTVPTPGAPTLQIIQDSPTTVTLSWADEGNFALQQSTTPLPGTGWVPTLLGVKKINGTNSVVVPVQMGSLFFRLN